MAITIGWDETSPANGDAVSAGAGKIRDDKQATRERTINGGHYWPQSGSTDAKSGIHAVSASNYVANEWNVYKSDLTTKLLTVTDSAFTFNGSSTISTGTLSASVLNDNGTRVVNKTQKRILVLNATGATQYATSGAISVSNDRPSLGYCILYMPYCQGGSGATAYTGTIVEIVMTRGVTGATNDAAAADINTIQVKKDTSANFLNAGSNTTRNVYGLGTNILSASVNMLAAQTGIRMAPATTTPTISTTAIGGGDVLLVTYAATNSNQLCVSVVIELDWQ